MKKFLSLILAAVMILSLASCSSTLGTEETKTQEETSAQKTGEKQKESDPITLPSSFSVGYARVDITPITWPVAMTESSTPANSAHDPIQLTCIALCDGENVALILTADMINMNRELTEMTKKLLVKNLDIEIPADNIFIGCTHTHTSVNYKQTSDPSVSAWKNQVYYKKLPGLAEEALRDLAPARAYVGTGHTEGLTFVRRYFREDGTFTGILTKDSSNAPVARHESDPDTELRTVRFQRENGKKDVLMVNYQTHYASAGALYPNQLSADFVHPFRETAEKELDCHFAYMSGAGGNLVFNSRIDGERKYPTFLDAIPHFMDVTKSAIDGETEAEVGKIVVAHSEYQGHGNDSYDQATVDLARAIQDAPSGSDEQKALVAKSDFYDAWHASCIVKAVDLGTVDVPLTAITTGDLAFCAFPYEMFDANGKEVRDASPYKMTFICSLAGDALRYIGTAEAYKNGGYEIYSGYFRPGSGEEFAQEMVRLLGECASQK